MSNKIDWREMTRNFLLGENGDETESTSGNVELELLNEAKDRRLFIKHEASRLRNTFNSTELDFLINEIRRL